MDRTTPINTPESSLNAELSRLPTHLLTSIRQELGVYDKELQSLTLEEKSRIVNLARQRSANSRVRELGPGGPQGPPGPSSSAVVNGTPVVNGIPKINPATQPTTSLYGIPANFLSPEFMQSMASTLED